MKNAATSQATAGKTPKTTVGREGQEAKPKKAPKSASKEPTNKGLQDCKFFLKNGACTNKACAFRHLVVAFTNHAAGKKCNKWPNCSDATCPYPHLELERKTVVKESGNAPQKIKKDGEGKPAKARDPAASKSAAKKATGEARPPVKTGGAEEKILNAPRAVKKVACLWDIENCAIPRGVKGSSLVQALRHQVGIGTPGVMELEFSCFGDVAKIPTEQRISLKRANVKIVDTVDSKKGAADRAIEKELNSLATNHQPPLLIVLITGDIDYVQQIHSLRYQKGFQIVLFHNKQAKSELLEAAHKTFKWEDISLIAKDLVTADKRDTAAAIMKSEAPKKQNDDSKKAGQANKIPTNQKKQAEQEDEPKMNNNKKTQLAPEKTAEFECVVCSKAFNSEVSLNQHKSSSGHTGLFCSFCQAGPFASSNSLMQHVSSKNHTAKEVQQSAVPVKTAPAAAKKELKFKCGSCSRAFAGAVALQNHQDRLKHFSCPVCSKAFNSGEALDQHRVELEHILSVCPVCSAGPFKGSGPLEQHQRDKGHYFCEECRQQYDSEDALESHLLDSGHMADEEDDEVEEEEKKSDLISDDSKKALLDLFSGLHKFFAGTPEPPRPQYVAPLPNYSQQFVQPQQMYPGFATPVYPPPVGSQYPAYYSVSPQPQLVPQQSYVPQSEIVSFNQQGSEDTDQDADDFVLVDDEEEEQSNEAIEEEDDADDEDEEEASGDEDPNDEEYEVELEDEVEDREI